MQKSDSTVVSRAAISPIIEDMLSESKLGITGKPKKLDYNINKILYP